MKRIILGSASPRRRELMEQIGLEFEVVVSHKEEHYKSVLPEEIWRYIKSEEPMDKAGAYGIQGRFAVYIDKIEGDYYNVEGLPVSYVYQEIKQIFESVLSS